VSLINCPECSSDISDKVATCYNCGYSVKNISQKLNTISNSIEASNTNPSDSKELFGCFAGLLVCVAVILLICGITVLPVVGVPVVAVIIIGRFIATKWS
jgi:uncharacterized membrane protein YvbJ